MSLVIVYLCYSVCVSLNYFSILVHFFPPVFCIFENSQQSEQYRTILHNIASLKYEDAFPACGSWLEPAAWGAIKQQQIPRLTNEANMKVRFNERSSLNGHVRLAPKASRSPQTRALICKHVYSLVLELWSPQFIFSFVTTVQGVKYCSTE